MIYYIKFCGGPWDGIEEEVKEIKPYYLTQYPEYSNTEIFTRNNFSVYNTHIII